MGRRCGCVGDECTCGIIPGRGISFSGTGNRNNPLRVSTTRDAHAFMQGRSSANSDVNLTGTGTGEDPYRLSVDFNVPDPPPLPTSAYFTPGTYTWVRPANTKMVDVTVLGGGASGSPGYDNTGGGGGIQYHGGRGGTGGAWSYARIQLPSSIVTATVVVGAGGPTSFYPSTVENAGGDTTVRFNTVDGPSAFAIVATGGDFFYSVGTHPGQFSVPWTDDLPLHRRPSGGAGGGGGGGTGSLRDGHAGGGPDFFGNHMRMAGYGGDGGDSTTLQGAGVIFNGQPGGRGAGGGGGGGPSAGQNGGNGGAGGDGAAWIVSI